MQRNHDVVSNDPNSMVVGSTYKLSVCLVCRCLCAFVLFVVVYVHLSLYLYLLHQDQPGPVRACAVRPSAMVGSARLQLTARTASTRIREQLPRSVNSWWEHKRVRVKWGVSCGDCGGLGENVRKG